MEIPTFDELKDKSKKKNKDDLSDTRIHKQDAQPSVEQRKVVFSKSKKPILNGKGGYGTGKRKNSIARIWIKPGKGKILVNQKELSDYFSRESYIKSIAKPLIDTNTHENYDVLCKTKGGGVTGQAGAIIHGIAKALDCISDDFHQILRKSRFLTRDSRVVERKKYGQRKARKSAQFSKR